MLLEICFWCLVAFVLYTYAGYPLLLAVAARLRGRPVRRAAGHLPSVSFVISVHNEERQVARRLDELIALIEQTGVAGEIIVISDGSTDATAARARSVKSNRVIVVELPRGGKAAALTHGSTLARNEILVFADVRQTWAPDALRLLLENFADPEVGAATGDLVVESRPGVLAGVGLYWRMEKMLRRTESRLYSMVGATGAIAAVRRGLFPKIPKGTLLDDVYWPLRVAMKGYRVIHDSRANAYDRLPEKVRDEFRRKVRTLTGNYQLMARVPAALLPWRNPICWQFLSHKVFRLMVPWALLALPGLSLALGGPFYLGAFAVQAAGYGVALLGLTRVGTRSRLAAAGGTFLVLNAAAWLAFWKWSLGQASLTWSQVAYEPAPRSSTEDAEANPIAVTRGS